MDGCRTRRNIETEYSILYTCFHQTTEQQHKDVATVSFHGEISVVIKWLVLTISIVLTLTLTRDLESCLSPLSVLTSSSVFENHGRARSNDP